MRKSLILIVIALCIIAVFIPTASSSKTTDYNGSASDGYISYTNATYLFAHNNPQNKPVTINIDGQLIVGQTVGWTIYRSYLYFDTSGIPDGATIYEAKLHMYVETITSPITVHVIQDTISGHPHSSLESGDYKISEYGNHIGGFPYSWNVVTTGWNEFLVYDYLSVPDLVISKTDTTKFALVSTEDFDQHSTITGPIYLTSANGANRPYLSITYNQPPATPAAPTGAATAYKNYAYAISFSTTDPEGDQVKYDVDWGDGIQYLGYYPSGQTVSITHKYGDNGLKTIKVKACDNDTHGMPEWTDWSGGMVVNISAKATVDYNDVVNSFEDPNQKINRVSAEIYESDEGWKNMRVWWTLNDAAMAQGDLNILVTLENSNSSTVLYEGSVRDHLTKEKGVILEGFDSAYTGWNFWNFKIKAVLTNPAEPYRCDKGDNTAELYMVLGMWVYMDFMFFGIIAAFIALIIFIIYKSRRIIFMKWYDIYKIDPNTWKPIISKEGDMPGILERLAASRDYWKYMTLKYPVERLKAPNPNIGKDLYRTVKNVAGYVPGAPFVYGGLNKRAGKVQKWWKDMPPDVGNRMATQMANMTEEQARNYALKTKDKLVSAVKDYKRSGQKMPKEMYKDVKRAITAIDKRYYPKDYGMVYIKKKGGGGYWKPKARFGEYSLGPLHWAAGRIGKRTQYEADIKKARQTRPISLLGLYPEPEKEKPKEKQTKEKGKAGRHKEKFEPMEPHSPYYSKNWHWAKRDEPLYDPRTNELIGYATGDKYQKDQFGNYKENEYGHKMIKQDEAVPKRRDNGEVDWDVKVPRKLKVEFKKKYYPKPTKTKRSPVAKKKKTGPGVKLIRGRDKRKEKNAEQPPERRERMEKDFLDEAYAKLKSWGITAAIEGNVALDGRTKDDLLRDKQYELAKEFKKLDDRAYSKARKGKVITSQSQEDDIQKTADIDLSRDLLRYERNADNKKNAFKWLQTQLSTLTGSGDVYGKGRTWAGARGKTSSVLKNILIHHNWDAGTKGKIPKLEQMRRNEAVKILEKTRKEDIDKYNLMIRQLYEDPRRVNSLFVEAKSKIKVQRKKGKQGECKGATANEDDEQQEYSRRMKPRISWFSKRKKRYVRRPRTKPKKRRATKQKKKPVVKYRRRAKVKRVRIKRRKPHKQKKSLKRRISWF
jgi:hypothetical protein